ncbi:hypothetical protein B296_00037001 [Ensete ventricosum]|uniref:Uncharacterized protein n=1 Tax=Ensete ventricosum TaxID=4639 RepID=A0A426Z0D3_ENSVE|nr:hypothetical protein B296_00037001 [Ensete ventricosum]
MLGRYDYGFRSDTRGFGVSAPGRESSPHDASRTVMMMIVVWWNHGFDKAVAVYFGLLPRKLKEDEEDKRSNTERTMEDSEGATCCGQHFVEETFIAQQKHLVT